MTEQTHCAINGSIAATISEFQERARKAFALAMEIEKEGWQLFAEQRAFMFEAFAFREKNSQGEYLKKRLMTRSFSRDLYDKPPGVDDITVWVLSSVLASVREANRNEGVE